MAMTVFDLAASLHLDKKDYEDGLNDAERQASKWGSKLGKAAKVGAVAVAATATAIVGVGAALKKGIGGTAEYGDNVDKMSQKIGISAQKYQQWDYVMQRAGTSIESMKMGMKTLSKQAESGSDAFQKLGISQEEVKNMSQEELFEKTVKGLADMEQGTERAALASQLLGRSGADMGALLNGGSKAIDEQLKMAQDYGMVMSDEAVKASAAFEDSVTTMQMTATGLKNRLMGELLPAATKVTDGLALIFKGDVTEGANKVAEGIQGIANKIVAALPKLFEVGGKIASGLGDAIIQNMPAMAGAASQLIIGFVQYVLTALPNIAQAGISVINSLATSIGQSLPQLVPLAVDAIITLVQSLIENIPMLIQAALALVQGLAQGIITALPKLIEAIPRLIESLVNGIVNNLPKIIIAGVRLVVALAKGLIKALPKLVVAVLKLVVKIPATILKAIPKLLSAGVKLIGGLWNGLKKELPKLPSKVWNWIKKIPGKIKEAVSDFLQAGIDLIQGLWNGIKEKFKAVSDWVAEHSKGLGATTRKALDAHSPSKMFRKIGYMIPEGMALGIQDGWRLVGSAMDGMHDIATDYTLGTVQDIGMSYTNGAIEDTISIAIGGAITSVVEDMANTLQDSMERAMENVNITLDKRQFGKMTRKAVADAL